VQSPVPHTEQDVWIYKMIDVSREKKDVTELGRFDAAPLAEKVGERWISLKGRVEKRGGTRISVAFSVKKKLNRFEKR